MTARSLFRLLVGAAVGLAPLLAVIGNVAAQSTLPAARESAGKAAFLYKFSAFVEWPQGTFTRPQQPLVIAVAGDDDVATDLEQLAASRSDDRPVSVRRVAEGASIQGAHVVFLGSRREGRLQDAIDGVKGPVLIVTEQPGALQLGSVLNFSSESGRVRFSASVPSAEARGLKLSSRLLAVAQAVEGRTR
jgi:hypothetical protein